jgi:hypothetical protein
MRQFLTGRRPSPAMAVAFAALLAALSGTAVALPGKNTVDSGDIKNGVVKSEDIKNGGVASKDIKNGGVATKDIKNGGVATKDIKNNDVRSEDVRNNTLTGTDINESSLGTVPSANSANTANTANTANSANTAANANRAATAGAVDGRIPFLVKLASGQSQTIAQNGSISLVVECNAPAGNDQIRILAATAADGAILQGSEDDHLGSGAFAGSTFLDIATPANQRQLVELTDTAGDVTFEEDIDASYVVGPDGRVLTLGSETTALGLNYAGAKCFAAGVVDSIG